MTPRPRHRILRSGARVALTLLLAAPLAGCATTTNPVPLPDGTEAPPAQDAKLVAYNVALGAVAGGLGALLNGEDEGALRRTARGAGWGAVGGAVGYAGKWQAGEVAEHGTLAYALPARLLHDVGASITENAAHGRPPLDRFASHLGPIRVEVRPRTGAVRARVMPLAAAAFGVILADGRNRLDVRRSLAYGSPVFMTDTVRPPFGGEAGRFSGYFVQGSVLIQRRADPVGFRYDTAAHELVHLLQLSEWVRIEAALRAPADRLLRRSAAYRGLARWVYLDSPALFAFGYEGLEGGARPFPCYYNNGFEREAEAFAERRPVGTCP